MNVDVFVRKSLFRKIIIKLSYAIKILTACLCSLFIDEKEERIWLIGLGDDIYANNGKAFYEYIKINHPELKIFWVCERKSITNLTNSVNYENIVVRGSLRNYILLRQAEVALYGFSDSDVGPLYFRIIKHPTTFLVNIGHGFDGIKGMPNNYYKKIKADMICAASSYEKNMKISRCGADANKVVLTGFARYDGWSIKDSQSSIKKVFFMPTWRDWYETPTVEWATTHLYKEYDALFTKLSDLAVKKDFDVIFKFHPRMKAFFSKASWSSERVFEANEEDSVQEALLNSDIIVTDYSSVFWDAIYMKKKVILYWFDEDDYRKERGLLADSYFYPYIVHTHVELLELLKSFLNQKSEDDFVTKYFDWQDNNNCERIYQSIINRLREV